MGVQIENDQISSILGENQLFNNLSQFIKAKAAPVVFIDKLPVVTCRSVDWRLVDLLRYTDIIGTKDWLKLPCCDVML